MTDVVTPRRLEKPNTESFIHDMVTLSAMLNELDLEDEGVSRAYQIIDRLFLLAAEASIRLYDGDVSSLQGAVAPNQFQSLISRLPAGLFAK